MRVLFLRKKNIGMTAVIIGLILILISFSEIFSHKIKEASLPLNNIEKLINYKEANGHLKFSLPSNWGFMKDNISGEEVLYSGSFYSDDSKIKGIVQLWKLDTDIYDFLEDSAYISKAQNKVYNYSINDIKIGNKAFILVRYKLENEKGDIFLAYEYFLPKGKEFVRMSFYVNQKDYKEAYGSMFEALVNNIALIG
jgi:hypothetical protein